MKKVLHLIKEYKGNSGLINNYVKALPKDEFSSLVCYLKGEPDGRNELDSFAAGVRYLRLDGRKLKGLNPGLVYSLSKIMRSEGIDIVHCHRHKVTVIGTLAAAVAGVRDVISHVHGLNRTRSWGRRLTNRIILKRVGKIIAISESVRQDVLISNRGIDPSKVVTVRNGINLESVDSEALSRHEARSMLGVTDKGVIFGTVGRLVETKGHACLIEAFSEARRRMPEARLVVIGDGPLRGRLGKRADALGISKYVAFPGYRKDVLALLRGLDVFVFPSVAEGLGMALLEAMASALPTIASNVGGIPEVFGNSKCGMLVPAGDPGALAAAMEKIGSLGSAERKKMGDEARKRIEGSFTTEHMCAELKAVYESVVGKS